MSIALVYVLKADSEIDRDQGPCEEVEEMDVPCIHLDGVPHIIVAVSGIGTDFRVGGEDLLEDDERNRYHVVVTSEDYGSDS